MYVLTITDGTAEQVATMMEGVAQGIRQGALADTDERQGTVPVWADDGQLVGYFTAIAEVTT